ncbi:MAG: AAA family ATPase [Myxococcota bacterium]
MSLPLLPIGLSEFADLRKGGFVYVDKTQQIHELLCVGKRPYFFSRPRRFGKSLLISTLQELFAAKQELFNGLWIGQQQRWDWSQRHPVIRLDMSLVASETPQELKKGLKEALEYHARCYDVQLNLKQTLATCFRELIEQLHHKHGEVVVLIDEYDKPLVDHLGGRNRAQREQELDIAYANRQVLKNFYTVLKAQGAHLRLVFITGVSKFAKTSIFSDLNNLTDLTLSRSCATLTGYTQQELQTYFAPRLQQMADERRQTLQQLLDDIKKWYDGFRFCSADVRLYNPFSTLLLLEQREFRAYWFQTGTPTFLTHLIKRVDDLQPNELAATTVSESAFENYELDQLHKNLIPLMVQTGYLTITNYNAAQDCYTVDYPNHEVRKGFLESLLQDYAHLSKGKAITDLDRLIHALAQNDLEAFFVALRRVLAGIPYTLHIALERYYQTLFYLIHQLLGYSVHTEVQTNTGRIDAVIDLRQHTYVFEFKLETGTPSQQLTDDPAAWAQLNSPPHQDKRAAQLAQSHTKLAQAALQQIRNKQYHAKYLGKGKPVTLVGSVFTVNDPLGQPVRQATAWISEQIQPK